MSTAPQLLAVVTKSIRVTSTEKFTVRRFDGDLIEIFKLLKDEHCTGRIEIDLNQGTPYLVTLRTKIPG